MTEVEVQGMTCGRCVDVITPTTKSVDGSAHVVIDLQTRRVRIENGLAPEAVRRRDSRDRLYPGTIAVDA